MSTRASIAEHWARMIQGQRDSGLSVAAFCRQNQVAESTFFAWRRRLAAFARRPDTPPFVEVKAKAPAPNAAWEQDGEGVIELTVGPGRRLRVGRGFDPQTVRELVLLLEGLPAAAGVVA